VKIPSDYKRIAKQARAQGWTIGPTRNGHLIWRSPRGVKVYTPSTPSDHRSLPNVIRKLRHAGLETK
jgi:hypothetical protein